MLVSLELVQQLTLVLLAELALSFFLPVDDFDLLSVIEVNYYSLCLLSPNQ